MKKPTRGQQGAALIEALVAMLIVAFGILGVLSLQTRSFAANMEGYQRSQALVLVSDMAERINLNRANAASYVANDIGTTDPGNCADATLTRAQKDLCEWAKAIQGAAETQGTSKVGAVIGARGCITSPATNQYLIVLAWQGLQRTAQPNNSCGENAYSSEDTRRIVSVVVQIGTLGVTTP